MTDPAPPTIDLLTVCFRTELPLLHLQARSMDRYLDPVGLGRILVIANDEDEAACLAAFEAIRGEWGRFADRVEFIAGSSFLPGRFRGLVDRLEWLWVARPRCAWRHLRDRAMGRKRKVYGWGRNSGWLMQQAFKLYSARAVTADHVVILDAKNFFVAPVDAGTFVADDGRARVRTQTASPKIATWVAASARRLGMELTARPEIPESSTPVVLPTPAFRAAVARIEAAVGPLESFFARRSQQATEFMLLYAAMGGGNAEWDAQFAPLGGASWIYRLQAEAPGQLAAELRACADRPEPILAIHRKWFFRLGAEDRAALADYLVGRRLLANPQELEAFVAR